MQRRDIFLRGFCTVLLAVGTSLSRSAPDEAAGLTDKDKDANRDLSSIGQAVVDLLTRQDANAFADSSCPSAADWQSLHPNDDPAKARIPPLEYDRRIMRLDAARLLDKVRLLGISGLRFRVEAETAQFFATQYYPDIQTEKESLPYAHRIEVVCRGEVTEKPGEERKLSGRYAILVESGIKFPTGWRCRGGTRWQSLPSGVADPKTASELVLLDKWKQSSVTLGIADDASLAQLGDAVVKFLQDRDVSFLLSRAAVRFEDVWEQQSKDARLTGKDLPDRADLEAACAAMQEKLEESAGRVLAQATRIGLTNATFKIKDIAARDAQHELGIGSVDDIMAKQVRLTLSVQSDARTPSGSSVSGDYLLHSQFARRLNGRWHLSSSIDWEQFPGGLLDEKQLAALQIDNYVAEHGVLPNGTPAPDAEFVRLSDSGKFRLSDLRGKLLFLEFWATWCGPCQSPLEKVQSLRPKHLDWKDRVEIITLSIDDQLQQARNHLEKRGWTNTLSAWAGPGGFDSEAAKAFRIRGVPTAYILSPEGKVVWAGHPMQLHEIGSMLDGLLPPSSK